MSRRRHSNYSLGRNSGSFELQLITGLLAFLGGWAIATLITPSGAFPHVPRWKGTLWVYLGANLVHLAVDQGPFATTYTQPLTLVEFPDYIRFVPIGTVGAGAGYVCFKVGSQTIDQNVSDALGTGTGYFLAALGGMVISTIQPGISTLLTIGLVLGAVIWIGSSLLGVLTGDLPFIGIASLGTIAALGVFVLLGGIALLDRVWRLVAISYGTAGVVGLGFGISRTAERHGAGPDTDYPRVAGIRSVLRENWIEVLAISAILIALFFGLRT